MALTTKTVVHSDWVPPHAEDYILQVLIYYLLDGFLVKPFLNHGGKVWKEGKHMEWNRCSAPLFGKKKKEGNPGCCSVQTWRMFALSSSLPLMPAGLLDQVREYRCKASGTGQARWGGGGCRRAVGFSVWAVCEITNMIIDPSPVLCLPAGFLISTSITPKTTAATLAQLQTRTYFSDGKRKVKKKKRKRFSLCLSACFLFFLIN